MQIIPKCKVCFCFVVTHCSVGFGITCSVVFQGIGAVFPMGEKEFPAFLNTRMVCCVMSLFAGCVPAGSGVKISVHTCHDNLISQLFSLKRKVVKIKCLTL
jgi:hypothetical protein